MFQTGADTAFPAQAPAKPGQTHNMGYDSAKTPPKQPTTTCVCPTHCNTIVTRSCPPVYPQHSKVIGPAYTLPGLKIRAG